jgi:hypothetical protein
VQARFPLVSSNADNAIFKFQPCYARFHKRKMHHFHKKAQTRGCCQPELLRFLFAFIPVFLIKSSAAATYLLG